MNRWTLTLAAGVLALAGFLAATMPAAAHGGFGWGPGGDRDERLAEHLGITVEKLQEARSAAFDDALASAVAAGRITQEQADLQKAARTVRQSIDHDAVIATALGVSEADVAKAREAGTPLSEIAGATLERGAFQDAMKAAMTKAIDDALKAGTITADQATQLKENGMGGCAGHGMMGGRGMRFSAPAPANPADV